MINEGMMHEGEWETMDSFTRLFVLVAFIALADALEDVFHRFRVFGYAEGLNTQF